MYVVAASFLGFLGMYIYAASPLFPGPGPIGFNFDNSRSKLVVLSVVPDSIGERSGLRAGDHIVGVNGVAVRRPVEWGITSMNFEIGRPMPLEIERDGKRIELTVTLGRRSGSALGWQLWMIAGGDLFTLILGLVVAFRRPHDWVARIGGWFLATAAIAIAPPIPGFLSAVRSLPSLLGALIWIPHLSRGVFPAIFVTFFGIFPRPLVRRRWVWGLVWAPVLLATAWEFPFDYALISHKQWTPPYSELISAGLFALVPCYLLGGLILMVVNYRRLKDVNERRRMRVLVAGTLVGWVSIGTFLGFFIVTGGGPVTAALWNTPVPTVLTGLYLAFPLSFAYAILRHRVFDLGVIVRRGLQYALARGVLLIAVP
ncbi:MAG: PDZ domain-containing protein, partial [Terriglobales bacterium]